MVSVVRLVGSTCFCAAFVLSAHASGGKGQNKDNNPAPASTAEASAPAGGGPSNNLGGGGGGSTNLASWLAAVAAQNLGLRLANMLTNECTRDSKCLVMAWSDFVAASYRIQAVKDQLRLFQATTDISRKGLSYIELHCTPAAGTNEKERDKALKQKKVELDNQIAFIESLSGKTETPDSAAPAKSATAANVAAERIVANMGVIGTGVSVVTGIYKALQPTYTFGSPASGGIDTNDLTVAMQAGSDSPDGFLINPPIAKGGLITEINYISAKLGKAKSEAQKKASEPGCKKYEQQLNDLATAIGDVQTQLEGFTGSFSSGNATFVGLVQDDSLDAYLKTNSPRLLDLNLSSSTAVSSIKSHWYGSIDQMMQTTLISRFRVMDPNSSSLLLAGSDAVFCQAYFRISSDASALAGSIRPDTGDMYTSRLNKNAPGAEPMCFDHASIGPVSAYPLPSVKQDVHHSLEH